MKCPSCERAIEPGQRFCTGCGRSLAGITDGPNAAATADATPAGVVGGVVGGVVAGAAVPDTSEWAEPEWAPTGSLPTQAMVLTDELPPTMPVSEVPVTEVAAFPGHAGLEDQVVQTPYDIGSDATSGAGRL